MPRTSERGGPQTRARILDVSAQLFVERGYDAVTVAEIARQAGVSSVTVFNHFPRKEDLFLDRAVDAFELVRSAVRERATGVDVLTSLRDTTFGLASEGHPLSGLNDRSIPFFRTVAGSSALVARAREIAADLQRTLAAELDGDPVFDGDAALFSAFFIAGYCAVMVATARRLIDGETRDAVVGEHLSALDRLFEALRKGMIW